MQDDTLEGNGVESIYGSEKKKLGIRKHCNTLYLRKEVVQSSIDLEKDWLKAGLARALEKGKQFKKEVAPRCSKEK